MKPLNGSPIRIDKKRLQEAFNNCNEQWFWKLEPDLREYTLALEYQSLNPISDIEDCLANIALYDKWPEWEEYLKEMKSLDKSFLNKQNMRLLKQQFAGNCVNPTGATFAQPEPEEIEAATKLLATK